MPRDIPVGNGRMLVTFDQHYQVRDFYFPHVGQENHGGSGGSVPCRFGVHADPLPGVKEPVRTAWSTDAGFKVRKRYLRDTLVTSVSLEHAEMKVSLYCNDTVDFHRRVMVRRIKVKNLADTRRTVRVIHHQAFHMGGNNVGDTAYYDPEIDAVAHYYGRRYVSATFLSEDGSPGLSEFATGQSGFGGHEGTWRDAEDGKLEGNPIAQGAVDSCVAHHVTLDGGAEAVCHLVLIAAESREELHSLHAWVKRQTPQGVIDRTSSYWRLWVSAAQVNFADLPGKFVELFKRSLLTVRTQVDDTGAIIAANDGDILQFARDTYSYVWPRDGALVADALDAAGFGMLSRKFFEFCQKTISAEGYFHHKYNPDGSAASSWHPWQTRDGVRRLPIQEDETALVVWALWRHFERHRDTEFVRPMWVDVVVPAADFMVKYRDAETGLPLASYDLWEERWGVHAFTVATVWAGLIAAKKFALSFGDKARAEAYGKAADEIRAGAEKHLYSDRLGRFVRRLTPKSDGPVGGGYEVDEVLDASMWAVSHFGMFSPDDARVRATMSALEKRLWVKSSVGGMARYENDYYHKVSSDVSSVAGNPWFICTLWLADDLIARAKTPAELKRAMPILEWVAGHALESGVLAEQVHPVTGAPMSVSPLTWSHAQVVSTAIAYLEKLEALSSCGTCRQPLFRTFGALGGATTTGAAGGDAHAFVPRVDTLVASASVPIGTARTGGRVSVSAPDCIGCGVCVTACSNNVLVSYRGKAVLDATKLHTCDLDGTCAEACPTEAIRVTEQVTKAA